MKLIVKAPKHTNSKFGHNLKATPKSRQLLAQLETETVQHIQSRTRAGKDSNLKPFKGYSKRSKSTGRSVDLSSTGTLLNSLKCTTTNDTISIYPTKHADIGLAHQTGTKHLPQRKWIGLDKPYAKTFVTKLMKISLTLIRGK